MSQRATIASLQTALAAANARADNLAIEVGKLIIDLQDANIRARNTERELERIKKSK